MKERQSITVVGKKSLENMETNLQKEGTAYYTDHKFDPEIGMYFVLYPQ